MPAPLTEVTVPKFDVYEFGFVTPLYGVYPSASVTFALVRLKEPPRVMVVAPPTVLSDRVSPLTVPVAVIVVIVPAVGVIQDVPVPVELNTCPLVPIWLDESYRPLLSFSSPSTMMSPPPFELNLSAEYILAILPVVLYYINPFISGGTCLHTHIHITIVCVRPVSKCPYICR